MDTTGKKHTNSTTADLKVVEEVQKREDQKKQEALVRTKGLYDRLIKEITKLGYAGDPYNLVSIKIFLKNSDFAEAIGLWNEMIMATPVSYDNRDDFYREMSSLHTPQHMNWMKN